MWQQFYSFAIFIILVVEPQQSYCKVAAIGYPYTHMCGKLGDFKFKLNLVYQVRLARTNTLGSVPERLLCDGGHEEPISTVQTPVLYGANNSYVSIKRPACSNETL